jgi:GNAT superfamily N-acetyltransferase
MIADAPARSGYAGAMTFRIRPMTPGDIDAATAALIRGDWGDRRDWWTFVVAHAGCAAFLADDGGEILGTGVATINGPVGWVGTIYVVPERRRQGIALALSEAVCDALEAAGCRTLVLVATPEGRPVYERLGFVEATWYRTFERDGAVPEAWTGDPATTAPVRSLQRDDLESVLPLDAAATGEDRTALLRACAATPGGLVSVGADGRPAGFVVKAPWRGAATIAPDPRAARDLLRARLVAAGPGHTVRTGILEDNGAGFELLAADGWLETRRIIRMHRGAPLAWHPEWIWGQLGFAVG